jgi:hypothetical protein
MKQVWKALHNNFWLQKRIPVVKEKLPLCPSTTLRGIYRDVEVKHLTLQISALNGGQWLASHANCFIPRDKTPIQTGRMLDGSKSQF